jgi:hypothetical protein
MKYLIPIILFVIMISCSSTYYLGKFSIGIKDSYSTDKNKVIEDIKNIAVQNSLKLDTLQTNNDTLAFLGPPYHYIKFIFK